MRKRHAFSLVELLVVVVIICILAAVVFVVASSSKASAGEVAAKEYLHQQYLAIQIYSQDHDDQLPLWQVVQDTPSMHAPCSPLDNYWKSVCWHRSAPMLGSFGYVGGLGRFGHFHGSQNNSSTPLLADVFSAHYKLGEFSGNQFPDYTACAAEKTCFFPEKIWFVYSDGSLAVQHNPAPPPPDDSQTELFSWPAAFARQRHHH
jgi:prepilin-type N-terminal cleavage/methylation domain-containing protein